MMLTLGWGGRNRTLILGARTRWSTVGLHPITDIVEPSGPLSAIAAVIRFHLVLSVGPQRIELCPAG